MKILQASTDDAIELTALTMKSKAYWGFSTIQLEAWREELTITAEYIADNYVFKLELNQIIIGYYSYKFTSEYEVVLDNLFILPLYIGKGYGKILMDHFLDRMQSSNIKEINLESEPKAEAFYLKFGFRTIESIESSLEGRYLAIMNKKIEQ